VTGAADDDPSGIATYSQTGAPIWLRAIVDSALDAAANDSRSGSMCKDWFGNR